MIETKSLEIILTIANAGSLHKASEILYLSQPALSVALNKLEKQLGVKLFERTNQGITPTEICTQLLPLAKSILAESNAFSLACNKYRLLNMYDLDNLSICFRSYPVIFESLSKNLFASLKKQIPNLSFSLSPLSTNEPIPFPNKNEIIIFIDNTKKLIDYPNHIIMRQIIPIYVSALIHKNLMTPMPVVINEKIFAKFPLITIQKDTNMSAGITQSMAEYFRSLNPDLTIIDVPNSSICYSFIEQKLGVSFSLSFDPIHRISSVSSNLISIPLIHSNPVSFSLCLLYDACLPTEFIDIFIQLYRQELIY